ncbi:hypothetical protein, variant 2, partial [Cladophialophora immunda]
QYWYSPQRASRNRGVEQGRFDVEWALSLQNLRQLKEKSCSQSPLSGRSMTTTVLLFETVKTSTCDVMQVTQAPLAAQPCHLSGSNVLRSRRRTATTASVSFWITSCFINTIIVS